MGVVILIFNVVLSRENGERLPFYTGWAAVHTGLVPPGIDYAQLRSFAQGRTVLVHLYFAFGTTPVLAFTIFGLFGLTKEARTSYWSALSIITRVFGWEPAFTTSKQDEYALDTIEFVAPPQERTSEDERQR